MGFKSRPTLEPVELARRGDIDALFELLARSDDSERDVEAYKWLCVAADFGHEGAESMAGDWLEASSLRYDDDGYEQGGVHWDLGMAYLEGSDGLPLDHDLAREHLEMAVRILGEVFADVTDVGDALKRLDKRARAVLHAALEAR